jgi:hypothetical protein
MNRRELLAEMLTLPLAAALGKSIEPSHYGEMTVDRWDAEGHRAAGRRVYCDGKDITNDCFWFDDTVGEAKSWKRDHDGIIRGRRYHRRPNVVVHRGKIEVR